jgi:hypothetical protein
MEPLRFQDTDIGGPPAPGWYAGTVMIAGWRQSAHDNRMVHVVLSLEGVLPPFERIADYFVLEGATPRGRAYSRKRLVALFHAGGLWPQPGDEIRPEALAGLSIEVKVVHELWKNTPRLQIVGYRPRQAQNQLLGEGDGDAGSSAPVMSRE